jgi:hypothetical protein
VDLSEKILHGLDGPCFQATARMAPRGGSKEAMGAGALARGKRYAAAAGQPENDAVKRAEKGPLRKGKVLPIQRF